MLDQNSEKKTVLKSKRVRTIFTPEQLELLEAEFERQQYMVGPERLYLAHTLQLTEAQVKVWFQNRRIKWRKHHLDVTHQRLSLISNRKKDLINFIYRYFFYYILGHSQKQLLSENRTIQNNIKVNDQQDSDCSISPLLTPQKQSVCPEKMYEINIYNDSD